MKPINNNKIIADRTINSWSLINDAHFKYHNLLGLEWYNISINVFLVQGFPKGNLVQSDSAFKY